MSTPRSELAWCLDDYEANEQIPPPRIAADPEACEGELMSQDELDQYLSDCVQTLRILSDHRSERYGEVWTIWLADLDFLLKLGRIDDDQYNELTDEQNYAF